MIKKIILLLLLLPLHLYAEYFDIENYEVYVKINKDSTLEITETILVNFHSQRHGIIRKIPIVYELDKISTNLDRLNFGSKNYTLKLYDIGVEYHNYNVSQNGNYIHIKIGDKNRFVSGIQKYTIKYKIYGGINFFTDHSELYWNIIGHEWDVKIKKGSFSIIYPEEISIPKEDVIVFYGPYGSNKQINEIEISSKGIHVDNIPLLLEGNGVTVAVKFPKNYLQNGSFWLKLKLFYTNNPLIILPLISLILSHIVWLKFGRDKDFIKVVEYFPPEDTTPAEAGVIIDDLINNRDIISLIYYWATKGIVRIEEIEGDGFLEKNDYIITKLKELPSNAKNHEKIMFNGLFNLKNNVVVSSLKNNFYLTMKEVKESLNRDIENSGLYYKDSRILRNIFIISGILLAFSSFYIAPIFGISNMIYTIISAFIIIIYGFFMPNKTVAGLEKYKKIVGFKEFLDKTEKAKIQYLMSQNPTFFETTLPYAISFGMADRWIEKFNGILKEPPDWFLSQNRVFHVSNLNKSISSSISRMNNYFTSSPSSAKSGGSGFSGGGSGGGFGGGGGSSW
ncbi:MAG: DUF2207 domain-containing protein [Calditerrivibrio sp.]|nr:DUF2207 domain-containing protein [Calditerrivibrio sp.]MCA1932049.1 DUF2207 domain-containing protein [Calditerrivibrio sp.]